MIIHKMISNTKNAMAPRGMNLFCSKSVFMIGIFLMLAAKLFAWLFGRYDRDKYTG